MLKEYSSSFQTECVIKMAKSYRYFKECKLIFNFNFKESTRFTLASMLIEKKLIKIKMILIIEYFALQKSKKYTYL